MISVVLLFSLCLFTYLFLPYRSLIFRFLYNVMMDSKCGLSPLKENVD